MKLKVTNRLTYPDAKKLYEQQKPEFTFAKVVQSMTVKPQTKTASTQYHENDLNITENSKVIVARKPKPNASSQAAQTNSQNNQRLTAAQKNKFHRSQIQNQNHLLYQIE